MKNYILLLVIILFTVGCKKDKVEIYLLNKRIESSVGVPLKQTKYYRKVKEEYYQQELDGARLDTVSKEYIFAGKFIADTTDLQEQPFISDEEIIFFNLKNNKIRFAPAAVKRIVALGNKGRLGTQFIIAVNKKPAIEGYFMYVLAAGPCHWYCISYSSSDETETSFELYNGYMRGKHEDLTPPYPPELIEAFRSSGRLIE